MYEHKDLGDLISATGWRAKVLPQNHPVNQYEFDVIVGANGKSKTLDGV